MSAIPLPPELHSPPPRQNSGTRNSGNEITIVRSESENPGDGTFHWLFENSDGTKSEQKGYLKNAGTENEIQVMEGSYSYIDPTDGKVYMVSYIADENGYQPSGPHLPK